jgi:hypothetical protein
MSTNKGLIRLRGSIGGFTFYKAYGRELVRRTAGPSREQIMSDPTFQRTRENLAEFGGCSKIAKAFRTSLAEVSQLTDGQFGNRLTKLFKHLSLLHKEMQGQRPMMLSQHRADFRNFECNITNKLPDTLAASLITGHNEQRTVATVTMQAMQTSAVNMPAGATHFRLVQALGLVSDYCYDTGLKGYRPLEPTLDTKGLVTYSDYHSIEAEYVPETTLVTKFDVETTLPCNLSVVHTLGITFFQRLGSICYPLKQGQALRVLEIF